MLRNMLIRLKICIALTISINSVGDYLFGYVNTKTQYYQFCRFDNIQDLQLMKKIISIDQAILVKNITQHVKFY